MTDAIEKTGRVAIITGSTRGIGNSVAAELASAGFNVVISSRRSETCEEVAEQINQAQGQNLAIACSADIADKSALEDLVSETVSVFGRLDCMVCNAASSSYFGPLRKTPDEDFEHMLQNNIVSAHWLTQASIPHMEKIGGGSVIYIASISGFRAYDSIGAYSVSKSGLLQLARNYARELGPSNIRVNAISPGVVETDFSRSTLANPEVRAEYESATCLGRLALPDDIAPTAAFLAGPGAAFITGQNIVIDGGASV
ncbi:oxidoreductase [Aurantiacibacter atlanticus]|uniref:Oxidoreductase n=1 Tax=Aurantiacibacter atlanticus TaxID=1648404 RepID=A0A0H4VIZ1_9SPHN|nr:SDR family oxidoreductase [Aurantiacibacter atlanticus]AKQ42841.1 oxidoreductase [Aurantiacibacter atlanticus]